MKNISEEQALRMQAADAGKPVVAAKVRPMIGSAAVLAVSRTEAGKMLSVSWRTIERMVNRGQLRALKVLGQWRIPVSEIHVYMRRGIDEQSRKIGG